MPAPAKRLTPYQNRPGVAPVSALHPFTGMNVWSLFAQRAEASAAAPFIVWQPFDQAPVTLTYAEVGERALRVAGGLHARGVRRGDPVIIHLENCPEFLIAWLACAALGAVAVTTNTRCSGDEFRYFASHSGAVGAITQPKHADLVSSFGSDLGWIVSTDHDGGVECAAADLPDNVDSFASLANSEPATDLAPPVPMAPMSVQYTSGTTARPKGVVWTHANVLWAARQNATKEDLHPDDCHLVYMPLFHTNALAFSTLASLWVGARIVLVPKWSTSRFWDWSVQHGCTWLCLIGPALNTLLTTVPPEGHAYRMFGTGICDLPFPTGLDNVKTIGWWGMTETMTMPVVGDPYRPNRPLSMGRPSPDYGISVVNADGTDVEPEQIGELRVTGVPGLSLFAEYLHDPDATAASFDAHGRFCTGDLVVPHADGYLSFADRSKDMLKVGGENVAASEVERVIYGVTGVREAAVVGRPDDRLDEVPVAFVIADGAGATLEQQIVDACRELLADFKVPREVYFVSELPRSLLRKVSKAELRRVANPSDDRALAEKQWIEQALNDPSGDAAEAD
jgi:crotonobetaine/carnitine-CoA ligase